MQPKKRLLDVVRDKIRFKHYSYATESSYVSWIKRYILYHDKRHPLEMGKSEIEAFLTFLAVEKNVSPSTQNQAFMVRELNKEKILALLICNYHDSYKCFFSILFSASSCKARKRGR